MVYKKIRRTGRSYKNKKNYYNSEFRPQTTQLVKQPGLSYTRRTFNNVLTAYYSQAVSDTAHQSNYFYIDVQQLATNCPEYSGIAGAYKFLKINNVRCIIHNFNSSMTAGEKEINQFPLAICYDGSVIAGSQIGGFTNQSILLTDIADNAKYPTNGAIYSNDRAITGSFSNYRTCMSLAKSKIISSSPDYFVCSVNNSANRLREACSSLPSSTSVNGNYGVIACAFVQAANINQGVVAFNIQIIFDCYLFEQ